MVLTAVVIAASAVSSSAVADQGGNVFPASGSPPVNGTRVWIHRNILEHVQDSAANLFLRVQNTFTTNNPGLFQIGYFRSTLSGIDCKPPDGNIHVFVEWKAITASRYSCASPFTAIGVADRFAVIAQPTPGYWGAYLGGTLIATPEHNVEFSSGVALAGGEWVGAFSESMAALDVLDTRMGVVI